MSVGRLFYSIGRNRYGHGLLRAISSSARRFGIVANWRFPIDAIQFPFPVVRELCGLWKRIHWSTGDGMMPSDQLLAVFRLAVEWPVDGDIVELGAWTGLTTCYLATACRVRGSGHVYAIDTFRGDKEGESRYSSIDRYGGQTLDIFQERVERAGLTDVITPLVGLTTEIAVNYAGRPVRCLLIDADHSHEGVRNDFRSWVNRMAPGGVMIFHDYLMPGVAGFVNGELAEDCRVSFTPGRVVPNIMAVTVNAASTTPAVLGKGNRARQFAASKANCCAHSA